jgi:acyl-coenzyme A thioesterase PaaI-like protein
MNLREPLVPPDRTSSSKCFVCGPDNPKGLHLKFYRLDEDAVTAELTPPPEWSGWDGLMHGGLQCVLLDEVTAWAISGLRQKKYFLTAGLEVKYRKPVRLDQVLTLVGRIVSEDERSSRILGQILNRSGEVLSEATAKVLHLEPGRFQTIIEAAP